MKLFSILLALFLSGCAMFTAVPPMVTMHGDVRYNEDQRQCVIDSAKVWEDQTSGVADINIIWDFNSADPVSIHEQSKNHKIIYTTSQTPVVKERDDAAERNRDEDDPPQYLLGFVKPSGGIHNPLQGPVELRLVLDRLSDGHKCRLAAIHELGHVLGVGHIPRNKEDIMYPSIMASRKACLKPDDLLGFCFVNDCGSVAMKPCSDEPTGIIITLPTE